MKWEKRLETSFTGYAQWFIDSRGWGDLTRGTVTEWPVPWEELYARQNLKDTRLLLGGIFFAASALGWFTDIRRQHAHMDHGDPAAHRPVEGV